jgi:hypothetical protein
MADTKYIKKIKMPINGNATDLQVKDIEAVSSINGYTVDATGKVVDAEGTEVLFANEPISTDTIDDLLGITN